MGAFNKATEEILHILDTVSHISRQTHLLALNASIESARAGEAGRGFSVVADEIRLLSNQTSQAVQDVSTLIDTIKGSLRNVNKYVDLNVCKVEEGVMQSQLIEESLEQMQQSFTTVTSYVKKIVESSQQEVQLAAGISNANIRTWFKEAIKRNTYVSEPYISAITKNPCVTVSAPLISEDGLIVGVMGIDIKIG